jgi:hypothetical protein
MREEDFGADDEGAPMRAGLDEEIRARQGVDETGADGLDVEGGAALHSELRLQQARARGKHHVGRGGADHDEIDVGRRAARHSRAPCGTHAARDRS